MNHMHLTQAPTRGALLKGHRAALQCGERALNWTQFAQRIARLAGVLQDFGVVAGTPVAMMADAGLEYFDYHYAVPWAGGVMVPLNTRLSDAELLFILDHAAVEILICSSEYAERIPTLRAGAAGLRVVTG